MSLKRITGLLTAFLTAAAVFTVNAVYAQDTEIVEREIKPSAVQYDQLCGKVSVNILPDADIYIKIIKHTPETGDDGYTVYDTIVKASDVYDDCLAVMNLECNNYNIEKQEYDGYYDIMVGVHKYIGSDDPEDILFTTTDLIITDKDVSGYDTNCQITVSLTDKELAQPQLSVTTEGHTRKYDMVFPHIVKPTEPPTTEPAILWGDANNDGAVNIRDAALIASKLSVSKSDELSPAADYNRDGSINIRDAASLAASLAKKS